MSSKKNNFEKQFNANKVNRVSSKNSKYKKKMSKADENYLKGDYTKSVGQTVFGVKNSLSKGQKVSGYGDDYVDTKGMKRNRYLAKQKGENPYDVQYKYTGRKKTVEGGINSEGKEFDSFTTRKQRLTKEEKASFKNTGILNHPDYRPKQKYNIMGSHKGEDANKFSDHFNFGTLDGLRTAKENQRTGKHLSNAFEYGKGLLKDTVIDAGVDFIKGIGGIGSTVMAGFAGLAEDSGNVFKAIADPKRDFNYYSNGRINTLENLKANQREMDKTGWGLGAGTYLNEAKQRADENEIKFLEDTGRYEEAREYARKVANEKPTSTKLLNATGFVMDLLAPSTVEDAVIGGIKTLGKGAKKSFNEMVKGTADISTGILPQETAKLMSNSKRYAGKGTTGASDDVFFSGTKGDTNVDRILDNDYSKRVARDTIKQNPNTQNISKFIERIETVGGVNKTPNKTTNPFDEILANRPKETRAKFEAKFEKLYQNYANDIDGLADRLDSMKPKNADAMYSYLQRQHPDVYEQLVSGSDEITDVLESTARRRGYETEQKIANDRAYHNSPNQRQYSNIGNVDDKLSSVEQIRELNRRYNELNAKSFMQGTKGNEYRPEVRLKINKGKDVFSKGVGSYLFGTLANKSVDELEHIGALFSSMNKRLDKVNMSPVISKELNNLIFGGQNVIRNNMYPNSLKSILEYFEDVVDYQKAVLNGEDIAKFRNKNLPSEFKIFNEYGDPNLTKDIDLSHMFAPSAVDTMFDVKRQDLGRMFGVKNKQLEIDEPLTALFNKKKAGQTLTQEEYNLFTNLKAKQSAWNKVYNEIKDLNPSEYEEYARKHFNKNTGYHDALDELAEQQARIDATKGRENQMKEAQRNQELGSDPYARSAKGVQSTASPRAQNMLHNGEVGDWQQVTQSNVGGNIKNQIKPKDKIEYGKSIGLKYVNSKYGIQIPKDKQTFKNVYGNKNVKNAVDNLLTLMNKEVNLTQSGRYGEEYAKIRLLVEDNVRYLDKLGVDRKIYFNQLKQQKLQLIQNIQQDLQVGKNLRGGNTPIDNIANVTNDINPLEMAHININGRVIDNVDELTPDQLQWQYLMTQGAKTIDELFDIPDANLLQRGDNIGDEIGNSLRGGMSEQSNNLPVPTNTTVPTTKNALERMASEQTNMFDDVLRIAPNDLALPNQLVTQDNISNPLQQMSNRTNGFNPNVIELSDEHYKVYDELLNLGYDANSAKKMADDYINKKYYNITNEEEYQQFLKDIGEDDIDEFEKIIAKENEEMSAKMREAQASKTDGNKPRAKMSEHTLNRLDYYLDKLNMPTPQTLDELDFNIPGVDEDGVIQDLTKNLSPNQEPTFEQFKNVVNKNLKKDSNKKSPLKDNELYNVYKSWLNTWKKGLTVYNPGWHIQNFFQNKGQNYLALGAEAFAPQTDARQILKNIQGKPNKNINIVDNVNNKTYTSEEISKFAQDLGVVDSVGEDISGGRAIFPKLEQAIDNSSFMKKLNESEQTARLHHFLTQIKRGMSPEEASKSVNKYLFDYGDKSKFDEFMSDFIDPFWMFHKNNTRLMATSAFEHGDKINKIVRGTKGLEHGIPEGTEQNENSKYGKLQMPYANMTDPINKDDYNYLYSENMMPSYEDTMSLERNDIESKLNPLLRIALQQSRGEGNFDNTIVEGDKANFGEITKAERREEIFKDLFPFMQPLNKTVDSVKERREKQEQGKQGKEITDRQVFYDWLNYITGNKGNWYRNLDDM